jgi:peptidoglycan hydrolase CwlO-like protein
MLKNKITIPLKKLDATCARQVGTSVVVGVFMLAAIGGPRLVHADSISEQIQSLRAENAANQAAVSQLQATASSYQDAIKQLQAQISFLQGQIDYNHARQAELQQQIEEQKAELARQKEVLGQSIKSMYLDSGLSTIEMLATSRDLSDFVDKETYQNAVQQKIQDTMDKIAKLQAELSAKKQEVDNLLAEQTAQQADLDGKRAEQANLLAMNQQQQADYNQKTKDNQSKINKLVAEQIRINSAGSGKMSYDPNNGFYPYANWPFSMSTAPGCVDGDGPDRWGYCTRQCVSYTAWAVERSGRSAPRYYGNANNWVRRALANGVPVYSFSNPDGYAGVRSGGPQEGDVAISTAGTWGHAMYVESVSGSQIYVSQYNAGLDGRYSTQWRNASSYYFLRFP